MNMPRCLTHIGSGVTAVLPLLVPVIFCGCRQPTVQINNAPTHIDRLIGFYPVLAGGRFATIADFENPAHMELFQLISVSDKARCVLHPGRGRRETGGGCLLFTSGSTHDTVVLNNTHADQWYLKRDWREYDLLLMSVYSPAGHLYLDITVAGGPPQHESAAAASIPLSRGWNELRLDLAEIGERIPLDDVQEIRLAVSPVSGTVQLRFDDILLTSHRHTLFGDSADRTGGLYVEQVGRRWRVGAGGFGADFELTFANGQIIEWFNPAVDPHRLHNLVRGATLTPQPVLPNDAVPSTAVAVRSRIVEMNPVRVVIESTWQLTDDSTADASFGRSDQPPFRRWVHTIYPTGQVYVSVEAAASSGLAVTLANDAEHPFNINVTEADHADSTATPAYATAGSEPLNAMLLYTVAGVGRSIRMTESETDSDDVSASASPRRVTFTAGGSTPTEDAVQWSCHLLLGAAGNITRKDVQRRVVEYVFPAPLEMKVGSVVSFNHNAGCYVISPDQGRVRFMLDGQQAPRFSPAFRILTGSEHGRFWVYVNHALFDRVARDAEGHLMFQLPGVIDHPTLVEVFFESPQPSVSSVQGA